MRGLVCVQAVWYHVMGGRKKCGDFVNFYKLQLTVQAFCGIIEESAASGRNCGDFMKMKNSRDLVQALWYNGKNGNRGWPKNFTTPTRQIQDLHR